MSIKLRFDMSSVPIYVLFPRESLQTYTLTLRGGHDKSIDLEMRYQAIGIREQSIHLQKRWQRAMPLHSSYNTYRRFAVDKVDLIIIE